jgi:sulfhydrogenase subunit beta (sulfur reductase)
MTPAQLVLDRAGIDRLIGALSARGYQVVGPTVRDGAIVYGGVTTTDDLPVGWKDEQEAATYRLAHRGDEALFGYVVGPQSPKTYFHPSEVVVWAGERDGAFLVAVNCTEPGGTCFCASMGTGPKATTGFDIALTEVLEGKDHYFTAEAGSERGEALLAEVGADQASKAQAKAAERLLVKAAGHMGRVMETAGLADLLRQSLEHPHWQEVAKRCLTCANCTLVCPTCFCANVEESTDLSGVHAERVRRWDSCFNYEFSLIHGGPHRASPAARYRQWMTHKLAWWFDQFGVSGCVGCGRCITWCPVGIDITAEVVAIRSSQEVA